MFINAKSLGRLSSLVASDRRINKEAWELLLLLLLLSVTVAAPKKKRAAAPKRVADRLLLDARGVLSMVLVEKWLRREREEMTVEERRPLSFVVGVIAFGDGQTTFYRYACRHPPTSR